MEIYNLNSQEYVPVQGGASPLSLLKDGTVQLDFTPICCRVNNKTEDLRFPIYAPKQIEYLSDLPRAAGASMCAAYALCCIRRSPKCFRGVSCA